MLTSAARTRLLPLRARPVHAPQEVDLADEVLDIAAPGPSEALHGRVDVLGWVPADVLELLGGARAPRGSEAHPASRRMSAIMRSTSPSGIDCSDSALARRTSAISSWSMSSPTGGAR